MCDQLRMVRDFADKPDPFALAIGEGERQRQFSWYLRPFRGVKTKQGTLIVAIGRDVTGLLREHAEMVRLETELVTANIVQEAFFPPANIDLQRVLIASYHRPAERCSGDWWGHFSLGPGLELVCIGDVTGHGAAAAFLTAVAHAACTTLAQLIAGGAHAPVPSPSQVLKLLSGVIATSRHESQLMTMFAVVFDLTAGVLRFANAGHVFPLLLPATLGDDRIPGDGTRPWLALNQSGCPLGYATIDEYQDRELPLRGGDRVVLYTDGLLENAGPDGTQWGRRRFNNCLVMQGPQSAVSLREAIIDAAKSHYAATPLTDDITFAIVEVPPKTVPQAPQTSYLSAKDREIYRLFV